jgi:prepilin-type N-terminal cleavage/methylation domain-containing protein
MKSIKAEKNKGFSLVELLLVIVLIAIIMALVTLSGSNMMSSTSAQTEARRLIRTTQALRSAWLAHYADTQKMIGVGLNTAHNPPASWTTSEEVGALSIYSDRDLTEETNRYGDIDVSVDTTGGRIDIGFTGPWHLGGQADNAKDTMKDVLKNQKTDYHGDLIFNEANEKIYIRVR